MAINRDALNALRLDPETAHRSGRRWRRAWCIALAAAALAAIAVSVDLLRSGDTVTVQTVAAAPAGGEAAGAPLFSASGYVVAGRQARVAAQVSGLIVAVPVKQGMSVRAGQVLARLDDQAARARLAMARNQLRSDESLVQEAQAKLAADQPAPQRQGPGQPQAQTRADSDAAQAALAMDTAVLEHARRQVRVDRDGLRLAQVRLDYTVIRAPFAGVVTRIYAHPGEITASPVTGASAARGICTLVDMRSLRMDVNVDEAYIRRVYAGQPADAVLDAYPDWHIPAQVIGVAPSADREQGSVGVRVAFDRLDPRILPQMSVQVRFLQAARHLPDPVAARELRIPESALHGADGGSYVFVVEHGRAERVPVKPGDLEGDRIAILTGLQRGQRVVVSAAAPLVAGTAVRVKP